jgi:hypothetical protein
MTFVCALTVAAASAGGAGQVYGPQDCTTAKVKPDPVTFACGDGGAYVAHITWHSWSAGDARGRGKFFLRKPSGHFAKYPAKITLHDLQTTKCGGRKVPLFNKAELTFPKREPSGNWRHNDLFCIP